MQGEGPVQFCDDMIALPCLQCPGLSFACTVVAEVLWIMSLSLPLLYSDTLSSTPSPTLSSPNLFSYAALSSRPLLHLSLLLSLSSSLPSFVFHDRFSLPASSASLSPSFSRKSEGGLSAEIGR